MLVNPVNSLYGFQQLKLKNIHTKNNRLYPKTVEYSLWDNQQVSFGSKRKKRVYSSSIPTKFEKPSKFKISKIPNLICPACGQKILTRRQYTSFLSQIRAANEEDYIPILETYEDYMCPTELEVFQDIKEQAAIIKSSGKTPHITDIVKHLREIRLPELEKIQLDKLEDMRDALKPLPQTEQNSLNRKFDTIQDTILRRNAKSPFRRKDLIKTIQDYDISNRDVKEDLEVIAESFPSSAESACAWIVKNAGKDKQGNERSPLELAEKLVSIASTSTDHILARNIELNHDDITNYMSMHRNCNSEKTDKSFNDWIQENPKRRIYLRAYFTQVKEALNKGRIKDKKYHNYVSDCVKHIFNISDGKVDFRSEFCTPNTTSTITTTAN